MYKSSIYNNYAEPDEDGAVLCYNSATGAVSKFDADAAQALMSGNPDALAGKDYFQALVDSGYAVKDFIDEYEAYAFRSRKYALGSESDACSFIIALTMKCNYRCVYCFEEGNCSGREASSEKIDGIFGFIRKAIEEKRAKKLNVNWFGGEPMLAYDGVLALGDAISEYCEKNGVEFTSSIVTNASLLTKEKLEALIDRAKVRHVQISVDGDEDWYVRLKGTTKANFEAAEKAILAVAESKAGLSVRMNVCEENVESLSRLAERLTSNPSFRGIIYAGKIIRYNDSAKFTEIGDDRLSEFEERLDAMQKKSPEYRKFIRKSLKPKGAGCGYMVNGRCLIDGRGFLYRCEHHVGNESLAIGDVENGFYHNAVDNEFLFAPIPEKCRRCSVMPACMGGCISDRILHDKWIGCGYVKRKLMRNCGFLAG